LALFAAGLPICIQAAGRGNMSSFSEDIKKFNGIYKLPVNSTPSIEVGVPVVERLRAFKNILSEELNEIDEIIDAAEQQVPTPDLLTMLADLLGDIQVYCASEMAKFGLPQDEILAIIMQSNFSKLGADGKPIYDERGKVQKGPNYWKPEPAIKALLLAKS
jgi:predicted HAD superfamily Cof-like phosphohydrolase